MPSTARWYLWEQNSASLYNPDHQYFDGLIWWLSNESDLVVQESNIID